MPPCAPTGEEPLTLAMMLEERGWFARAPIDIARQQRRASPVAVGKARAGRYGPRAFRSLPPALQEKYFQPAGERIWTVSPDLQRRVRFDVVNLMDDEAVTRHAAVPVIFCRNVFIYFSERSMRRTLGAFADAMPEPAICAVGAVRGRYCCVLATRFELQEIGGAFIYVKDDATSARTAVPVPRSERV